LTEILLYRFARPGISAARCLSGDVLPGAIFQATILQSQVNNIAQSANTSNINMHCGGTTPDFEIDRHSRVVLSPLLKGFVPDTEPLPQEGCSVGSSPTRQQSGGDAEKPQADLQLREYARRLAMKALVYQGPGKKVLEDRPMPEITAPTDGIVKIGKTTICGTDLHILKGDVPTCAPGRILGHEGVGVVEKVGGAVTAFHPGDRVIVSCISSCGKCDYCRRGMYSHCTSGGWILGNTIDGTQAEYVRTPFADTSLYHIPADTNEEALVMLSDILPTGFECGVLNGKVQPGSIIAIIGAGPIGLAALLTSQFYSPAEIIMVDFDKNRLEMAQRFGATAIINNSDGKAVEKIMKMTAGHGVDTAIEAVGIPASFLICQDVVAPGGVIANIGVHGVKADLHLEKLWDRNITITTRLVDTVSTPMLLKTVQSRKVDPSRLITHRFKLDQIVDAYETFGQAAKTNALKVIIES
jgi:alcohol dehydrogenase